MTSKNRLILSMSRLLFLCAIALFFFTGCNTYQGVVNFQASPEYPLTVQKISNFEPVTLQPSDILQIQISSVDMETVAPINEFQVEGYLIDANGTIEFPLVGKLQMAGKTIEEARLHVQKSIEKSFRVPPTVNVLLANFSVVVNGEVRTPSKIEVINDRISVIEAISRAGDFTPYSNRDSVMIIREHNGERSFGYLNFNSSEIFESPYFYLKQNDVVYVKPEKRILGTVRTRQDKLLPYISVGISVLLLSITIARNG